jgi:DNA mismatch endonuclease, patch repair protein
MPDNLTPEDRKKTMRAVKGKGTSLETTLFAMLAGMGLSGWRKNDPSVSGKPDAAFHYQRAAIFVDGCFWHGCPQCHRPMPQSNREYWERKIGRNVERARAYDKRLQDDGWVVVRIWEHEITKEDARKEIRSRIRQAVSEGASNARQRDHQATERRDSSGMDCVM